MDKREIIQSVVEKIDSHEFVYSKCLSLYDRDRDEALNEEEFKSLCEDLFTTDQDWPPISEEDQKKLFTVLDKDRDGVIGENDFKNIVCFWLKQILKPVTAVVIVDMQNDFIDGSLALHKCPACHNGSDVVPVINAMLDSIPFTVTVYTKDWHPDDHISFIDNVHLRPHLPENPQLYDTVVFDGPPQIEQKLWPCHCVQESWGSQLHPDLKVVANGHMVYKGTLPNIDSYSAFWDNKKMSRTDLIDILSEHRVTDVYLCGLAYDFCVGFTGLHSLEHGFRTIIVEDATCGIDTTEIRKMRDTLISKGAIEVESSKVKDMVEGKDRPPQLALWTAQNIQLTVR
ncbi:hypothetical protein ACJMK2_032776 [Sinanodonta woodiana]|uniref:nicotinamidase n=1 Tax=Sinanodonta woodiana TaxID=1069815 RepID=A0ABD3X2U1_SINWO